ncbi:MAG: hypothetical protein WC595_06260 [Candidatus Nanoarchaeia archaeon]
MDHHPKHSAGSKHLPVLFHILIFALLILFLVNSFFLISINQELAEKTKEAQAAAHLPVLQTILITPTNCKECDINLIKTALSKGHYNITSQKELTQDSSEAKNLIEQYTIEKLPALVITGEIENITLPFEKKNNAYVALPPKAPYYDLTRKKVTGLVTVTVVEPDNCKECFSLDPFIDSLKQQIAAIISFNNVKEDKELIEKYNLTRLPALLLSKEAEDYPEIKAAFERIGERAEDGTFILKETNAPYKDTANGRIKGLVTVTYIEDKTCKECYDVNTHKLILTQSLGVYLPKDNSSEKHLEVSNAQDLIKKYKITQVPTVIISKEIEDYNIKSVLDQVGTIESDGVFVFRKTEVIGTYKDLTTGKIITPKDKSAPAN